jgi:hypothetical protein
VVDKVKGLDSKYQTAGAENEVYKIFKGQEGGNSTLHTMYAQMVGNLSVTTLLR